MSDLEIVVLGAIAGLTIFVGLPLGRVRGLPMRVRALLNAVATGILLFLLWDVLSKGIAPIEGALDRAVKEGGSWLSFAWIGAVFCGGFAVGLIALVYYDRWLARRGGAQRFGPGAAEAAQLSSGLIARLSPAQRLSFFIALGIGSHNLSEGLAIGQSAASGELRLALLLVIGFGLHNATEGFGIVGPLAAASELPSWRFLGAVGLIGGGPTFLGTLLGRSFQDETVFVGFLALAAGSILYVVIELLAVARQQGHKEMSTWGVLLGFVIGLATDMVLTATGA